MTLVSDPFVRAAGVQLRIPGTEREVLVAFLDTMFRSQPIRGPMDKPAVIDFEASEVGSADQDWEEVHGARGLTVRRAGAVFRLDCGGTFLEIARPGQAAGRFSGCFWQQPLATQREFFLLALLILLHQHGQFGLHANAVERAGGSVLLVGPSGSGKTTLTIACLESGWACLSDDALLLEQRRDAVVALALRRGFACDASFVQRFPRLRAHFDKAPRLVEGKRLLRLDSLFPRQVVPDCIPCAILFPRIDRGGLCEMSPMPATEALFGLIQQSPGILARLDTTRTQLETLRRLVEQAHAYRVVLGTDAARDPGVAVRQLESVLGSSRGRHRR
ncbi:MAG: hypothetical protein R2762_27730 [Bryobacteraceae bacterium]